MLVTDTGIYINGNYYSQEQFIQLLDTAQEVQIPQTRSAVALVAGTWWIPGVGEVVITAAGVIIVGGAVIAAGTWIYNAVTDWFTQRAEISAAKSNIPSRLKDGNGNVKVGDFNQKVSGKTAYKEKGGWTIEIEEFFYNTYIEDFSKKIVRIIVKILGYYPAQIYLTEFPDQSDNNFISLYPVGEDIRNIPLTELDKLISHVIINDVSSGELPIV